MKYANVMMNDKTIRSEHFGASGDTESTQPALNERDNQKSNYLQRSRFAAGNDNPEGMLQYAASQAAETSDGPSRCPYCGALIAQGEDFCETCHRYIKKDVCSFCGGLLRAEDAFCPECGNSRGGIECPVCHTINEFAFCKQCGSAITEEAKQLMRSLKETPEFQELMAVSDELNRLDKCLPYTSVADKRREEINQQLRARVFELLKKDGANNEMKSEAGSERMTAEELTRKKAEKMDLLTALLEKFAVTPTPSPAIARNYAMASKPKGVRLAWVCNYKHAMHSSPCGCAKPHLGGKWVILGKANLDQIKDDESQNG